MDASPELLLVASETADPFATSLVDPVTGTSQWSHKGSELLGAVTGRVTIGGDSHRYLIVSAKDKPLLHVISIGEQCSSHSKSVVSGSITNLLALPDGSAIIGTIGRQIFTWLVKGGELLSVVEAHYQKISCAVLSSDGFFLCSASDDGTVCVFLMSDLMAQQQNDIHPTRPIREWRAHSLQVTDIKVTYLRNPRIVSCSKDHTLSIHSISMNECLLKLSADRPLTSCVIDPAESRLFLGTDRGSIAVVEIASLGNGIEQMVNTVGEEDSSASVFKGHLNEVRCTAVNHDGSLLASGDASGLYCVWDVLNGQCLRSQQTKGPICNLSFIIGWKKPNERVKYRKEVMRSLQRQPRANSFVRVIHLLDEPIETSGSEEHSKRYNLDAYLERLRLQESSYEISRTTRERTDTKDEHTVAESDHAEQARLDSSKLDEVVASLKARIAYLEKYNREIYTFAASKILEK